MRSDVVITGIGIISSAGIGKEPFWSSLENFSSQIKHIKSFENQKDLFAAEVSSFHPEEIIGKEKLRNIDRISKMALCAAKLALEDADYSISETNEESIGVVLGTAYGSVFSRASFFQDALKNGFGYADPGLFPNTVINSITSRINIRFGIKGFSSTISNGMTSSPDALGYAVMQIQNGNVEAVLVGGVEELNPIIHEDLRRVKFLAEVSSEKQNSEYPFSAKRSGAYLGEGAVFFLLESLQTALKRKSPIYGVIGGYGSATERKSINRYDLQSSGLIKAIKEALEKSKLKPEKIDLIVSGANSGIKSDFAEYIAIKSIIKNASNNNIPVITPKGIFGETLGASGVFQLASGLLIINKKVVPKTINAQEKDKRFSDLFLPAENLYKQCGNALILISSPLGTNSALLVSEYEYYR